MKRILSLSILAASVVALLSHGCSAAPKEVKLGVITSSTGTIAPYGEAVLNGVQTAVDELNAGQGIAGRKVKLLVEDDQSDPKNAVSALTKLATVEKVSAVIGPVASSSVMSAAPVADEKKVVILSPAGAAPAITNAGDFVFRNRSSGALEALWMADYAAQKAKATKAALLYINTDYGVGYKDIITARFKELGGTLDLTESFDQGVTDFRAQLAKVKAQNPQFVFVLGNPKEVGYLLKQSRELGLKCLFIANNVEGQDVLNVAGKAAEGLVIVLPYFDPSSPSPKVQQFVAKYQGRYGRLPDLYAANGYDAMYMVKAAMVAKGFTGEQVRDGLYALKDFEGVNGRVSFDKNGDVVMPLAYKQIKDGKFVVTN